MFREPGEDRDSMPLGLLQRRGGGGRDAEREIGRSVNPWRNENIKQGWTAILTNGNIMDLLLGGSSITFLRLAATEKDKEK